MPFKVERHQFRGVKGGRKRICRTLKKRVQQQVSVAEPNKYQETNRLKELLCNNNSNNTLGVLLNALVSILFQEQWGNIGQTFVYSQQRGKQVDQGRTFVENIIQEPFGQFWCNFALRSRLIFEDSRQNLKCNKIVGSYLSNMTLATSVAVWEHNWNIMYGGLAYKVSLCQIDTYDPKRQKRRKRKTAAKAKKRQKSFSSLTFH